jgi:putative addiction module component (TIGR02574 family)
MTRAEIAEAVRALSDDEKLDLLEEVWDTLDHDRGVPEWHKRELDRRLAAPTDATGSADWSTVKARILGAK